MAKKDFSQVETGRVYDAIAEATAEAAEPAAEQAAEHYRESGRYKDLSTGALAEYSNYLFNLHYQAKPQDFMLAAAQGYGRLLEWSSKGENVETIDEVYLPAYALLEQIEVEMDLYCHDKK